MDKALEALNSLEITMKHMIASQGLPADTKQSNYEISESLFSIVRSALSGGWVSVGAIEPDSEAEWELECRAFDAVNNTDLPNFAKDLICDLWREIVNRENGVAHPAGDRP